MRYKYTYRRYRSRYREPSIGQVLFTLILMLALIGVFADFETGLRKSYDKNPEEVVEETCIEENYYYDECK